MKSKNPVASALRSPYLRPRIKRNDRVYSQEKGDTIISFIGGAGRFAVGIIAARCIIAILPIGFIFLLSAFLAPLAGPGWFTVPIMFVGLTAVYLLRGRW